MAAFQLARKEGKAVAELEELGWIAFMLTVPEYNKRMLTGRVAQVKAILGRFTYPYIRRIAGEHGHFSIRDYNEWLKQAEGDGLARAIERLAQLSQQKAYLFWENLDSKGRALLGEN